MPASILFVDFENVHKVDLSAVPADVTVPFFFGASQNSVTREFHLAAHKLGPRYVPIEVAGQGKNALDFHIAFYLGEYLAKNPTSTCIMAPWKDSRKIGHSASQAPDRSLEAGV